MHTMHTRRSVWIIALALAAAAPAATAFGIAKVGAVRVAGNDDGTDSGEVYTAAEGTDSVFALFDFTGASKTDITVRVIANSLTVLEETKRYNGDGTASVEITGAAVYKTALASMNTYAEQLVRSINDLTSADDLITGEAIEAINEIERAKNQITSGLPVLASLDLDADSGDALQDLTEALEDAADIIADAQVLPADDIAGRQAFGQDLAPFAARIDNAVDDIAEFVGSIGTVALPTTGNDWSFDVSIRTGTTTGNTAAGSARFLITGSTSKGEDEPDEPTARPSATSRGNAPDTDTVRGAGTPTPRSQAAALQGAATAPSNAGSGQNAGSQVNNPSGASAPGAATTAASGANDDPNSPDAPSVDAEAAAPGQESAGEQLAMGSDSAMPTWTVPAGRAAEVAGDNPEDTSGQPPEAAAPGRGPNFTVLGLGLALLIGVALWYRRRA